MATPPPSRLSPASRTPLDAAVVNRLLREAEVPGDYRVEWLTETSSTNRVLAERAVAGDSPGLIVGAESQTSGRGRLDRSWESPPGAGLTFSVLWRPTLAPEQWPWLSLVAGLGVCRGLVGLGESLTSAAGVKWPNDVLLGDLKVAGLLIERVETAAGPAVVVGIGLNVDQAAEELPVPTATSLRLATGRAWDRAEVLAGVVAALAAAYEELGAQPGATRAAYREACRTLGNRVRISLPTGGFAEGRATELDVTGRLVVDGPTGRQVFAAGDVVHVRPQR